MIHVIAEELTCSQGKLTLSKFESSKCHTKVNINLVQDFDVENIAIKLQLDTGNL